MPRNASATSGPLRYAQDISIGPHVGQADEPAISAADSGQGVRVTVSYTRVLAEDTAESGAKVGMVDQFEMDISFMGDLGDHRLAHARTEGPKPRLSRLSQALAPDSAQPPGTY